MWEENKEKKAAFKNRQENSLQIHRYTRCPKKNSVILKVNNLKTVKDGRKKPMIGLLSKLSEIDAEILKI